jgi:hypothetical protein
MVWFVEAACVEREPRVRPRRRFPHRRSPTLFIPDLRIDSAYRGAEIEGPIFFCEIIIRRTYPARGDLKNLQKDHLPCASNDLYSSRR